MDWIWLIIRSITLTLMVSLLLFSANITYNLFFHPLRKFPGSKTWSATRIPWCYHQLRGRLHLRLLELHIQHGHIVRVAPNELSLTHPEAWKTIYGQRRDEMAKDPHFRLHTPTGVQNVLTADRETHSRQRRLLSHAFSESALREQEPILQHYANTLVAQLSQRSGAHGAVDIVAWLTFTTFDLIGHMSFGENFNCLDSGEPAPFVRAISAMASELTLTQICSYWRVTPLRRLLTPRRLADQRMRNIRSAMATVQRRIDHGSAHRDFLHYILLSAADDDGKGMSRAEINVNAFSLSIAGSESTATALSGAVFFLLTHPYCYRRVVAEVRDAHRGGKEVTLASTLQLTFLAAVITETLRLYPPVSIPMPRVVPVGGVVIADWVVPPGVTVGVPHYAISRHPSLFHEPGKFAPERWMVEGGRAGAVKEVGDCVEAMQPFSFGPRNCLGKNIARAEMRLLLAKLLVRFDWQLEAGQERWMEQKVQGFWQKPSLWCTFTLVSGEN